MACVLKTQTLINYAVINDETNLFSSLLLSPALLSCYIKMYTHRALFSSFIQNSSNEDKLLPG